MAPHKSFQDIYKLLQEQDIQTGVFILVKFKPTLRNICTGAFLVSSIVLEICFTYSAFVDHDLLIILLQILSKNYKPLFSAQIKKSFPNKSFLFYEKEQLCIKINFAH